MAERVRQDAWATGGKQTSGKLTALALGRRQLASKGSMPEGPPSKALPGSGCCPRTCSAEREEQPLR